MATKGKGITITRSIACRHEREPAVARAGRQE
jgi:hypothetical protein